MSGDSSKDSGDKEYVRLVSSDGFEYSILRSAAAVSGTLRGMLSQSSNFVEAKQNRVVLPNIRYCIVQRDDLYNYANSIVVSYWKKYVNICTTTSSIRITLEIFPSLMYRQKWH
jgi:hypothetical protein